MSIYGSKYEKKKQDWTEGIHLKKKKKQGSKNTLKSRDNTERRVAIVTKDGRS